MSNAVSDSTLTPSSYQVAIEDHFRKMLRTNGTSSLVINALAGSGKTTTLVRLAAILKEEGCDTTEALAVAFNKDIVTEFGARLAPYGVVCKTFNSLGNGALWLHLGKKKLIVDPYKYKNIISEYLINMAIPAKLLTETGNALSTLVSFTMSSLIGMKQDGSFEAPTNDEILGLVGKYGLDMPPALSDQDTLNMVRSVLVQGEKLALNSRLINFDDQIYLPIKWNVRLKKYPYLLTDENQDTNPAKLELAIRSMNGATKVVWVGDEFQSIMGFSGADTESMSNTIRRTNAFVLPLSVCYRCPKSVIAEAQKIVPSIQAAPNAIEGIVREIPDTALINEIRNYDMILCRLTAPLVKLTIQLLGMQKPAKLKGREIGKSIVAFVKNALGKNGSWDSVTEAIEDFYTSQHAKISGYKNPESQLENLADKYQCAKVLLEAYHECKSVEEFSKAVNGLFDDGDGLIELSTIHRSKGLGRKRVFIIKPEKLPLVFKGQQEWERQQEMNLKYVAITRASEELIWVQTTDKTKS